jgi:monolysocardiolipin acyltransferase
MRPDPDEQPAAPSAPWRAGSAFVMGAVGLLCRGFLMMSKTETHGLEKFVKLMEEREDVEGRQRGLVTGMRLRRPSIDIN